MGTISLTFRRLGLLLWKNLLMRRRHWIVTSMEILLPTLMAIAIVYIQTQTDLENTSNNNGRPVPTDDIGFDEYSEESMVQEFTNYDAYCTTIGADCIIAYAPNSQTINEIMAKFMDSIETISYSTKGFPTERELETYQSGLALPSGGGGGGSGDENRSEVIVGGIVFASDVLRADDKISYKIRTDRVRNTQDIFPFFQLPGPDYGNAESYYYAGFSGAQILLDKTIIAHLTGQEMSQYNISTQPMPHPKFIPADFRQIYQFILPQFTVMGFIFIVPSIIRAVVAEKETGIKELMKLMGLSDWMHWIGWLINSLFILIISITIIVVLYFVEFKPENGPVMAYSDPTLWWFVLFLYVISASCWCFFVSAFFEKSTLGTTVGVIMWIVTYLPIALLLDPRYEELSLAEKMLTCLMPNMALHYAFKIMCGYEAKGEGAKWSNIAESLSSNDSLTVIHVLIMFVVNSIVYMMLTVYIENILPTTYGVRRPWYYIFLPSTWWSRQHIAEPSNSRANSVRKRQKEDVGFEAEPADLEVGVDIRGLRKVFGKAKVAVDNVTIKMFHGQITALLGHNGAGKTTTISMITGLYGPSGGNAYVNGYDINTNMEKVRENLGLCPQHNMLFQKLTVAEHLLFFGRLKGLSVSDAKKQMKQLLRQLQFEDKENVWSLSLSGGQKRKLSLGCALVGGNKVIVLDEPTSGMDPEARRAIWDLLLELRGQRTILLTTHFMEEADVLGDRIAIMADGKLQCCGSAMYLKRFYGAGYTLKLTLFPLQDIVLLAQQILTTVQHHIPQAYLKTQVEQHNGYSNSNNKCKEISIVLPTSNTRSGVFVPLFRDLSQEKIRCGVETMGLSLTTMDEVFVKVGELNPRIKEEELIEFDPLPSSSSASSSSPPPPPPAQFPNSSSEMSLGDAIANSQTQLHHSRKITGFQLLRQQFWALILKRVIYTSRKWRHFLSQLIIPVLALIITILVSNSNFTTRKARPPLKMSFSSYKDPITMFWSSSNELTSVFERLAIELGTIATETKTNLSQSLLDFSYEDLGRFREGYVVALELNETSFKGMFSTIPFHSAPLAINLISNILLRSLPQLNPSPLPIIEVTNHPFRNTFWELLDVVRPDPEYAATIAVLFTTILPIGLALLAATYVIFAVDERLCKAKQLQLMSGVNPLIYWTSAFIWDYFMILIVICLMIACFPIFERYSAFTANNGAGVMFLFLAVFGFSAITFSYIFSLFVGSVPGGFALVSIIHIFTSILNLVTIYLDSENPRTRGVRLTIRWIGRLFPTYGAGACSYHFSHISARNAVCNILPDEVKEIICVPGFLFGKAYQACCDNCKELEAPCFKPAPYIEWKDAAGEPGIGQELFYMGILAILYKLILISIELGLFTKLRQLIFRANKLSFTTTTNDEDVLKETERVNGLIISRRGAVISENDEILVQNLSKSYGTFAAVSNLTFGVGHGECFGLLGVNGAGKTTTFRMLTGDEICSGGNAFTHGTGTYSLHGDRKQFLSGIGYCPQFDGIIDVLNGREMLQLFSRLRGVPSQDIDSEADKWLRRLGLSASGRVECRNYSGGMKRRLSAAMAMVGDPPLLFLDEPTSGVDPVARRQFWQVINSIRNAGQAIILTSHSMEECEALCTRLGIMVNGELQCLGGVQHLKNKFAQGYSLTIKLKSNVASNNEPGFDEELNGEISHRFHPCALKDRHLNILQYQVYNTSMPWDVLFQNMEDIKFKYGTLIEEYSVSGTTLEEIFLSFARQQYSGERKARLAGFRKCISCLCQSDNVYS